MQTLFAWLSSFFTVAAVAGLVSLLGDQLGGKNGVGKKLRYLCALAVIASLAAPLPGFIASLQKTVSENGAWADQLSQMAESGNGSNETLSGKLFSKAAAQALEKNAGDELREKLELDEKELALFFTVEQTAQPLSDREEGASERSDELLFSIKEVKAELYTLRAITKTDEIRNYLEVFACPVEIEEQLSDSSLS